MPATTAGVILHRLRDGNSPEPSGWSLLDAQREQRNGADPEDQHNEGNRIVVEPVSGASDTHDANPLNRPYGY
jgi:hypothetical protein